jgi:hypothetical protein
MCIPMLSKRGGLVAVWALGVVLAAFLEDNRVVGVGVGGMRSSMLRPSLAALPRLFVCQGIAALD